MSLKIYFAVLEEIYNNVFPRWSVILISCNHSITRLISFTKNGSNQRSILSLYGPSSLQDIQLVQWIPVSLWYNKYEVSAGHPTCLVNHFHSVWKMCASHLSKSNLRYLNWFFPPIFHITLFTCMHVLLIGCNYLTILIGFSYLTLHFYKIQSYRDKIRKTVQNQFQWQCWSQLWLSIKNFSENTML